MGDGIRQLLSNQTAEFNEWFFTTVQIVFAGNDSEGLEYGTIGTPEKYFLRWKEHEEDGGGIKKLSLFAELQILNTFTPDKGLWEAPLGQHPEVR